MRLEDHMNYIQWMGAAGFLIQYNNIRIGLDLYFSNYCMNERGEGKRLMPPPCEAGSIKMDYLISSHEHGDHLDMGSMEEWFAVNENLKLIGPEPSLKAAEKMIPRNKMILLDRGGRFEITPDIMLEGVFCDHGEQTPEAIGVVLKLGGLKIYFTGDTRYRRDLREITGIQDVDILLVPINPAFGNPGTEGAAKITAMFSPKIVIPCHFWLTKEHGDGDPGSFEKACAVTSPETKCIILASGEKMKL